MERIKPEYSDDEIVIRSAYMRLFRATKDGNRYRLTQVCPAIYADMQRQSHAADDGYYCWLTDAGKAHWKKMTSRKYSPETNSATQDTL